MVRLKYLASLQVQCASNGQRPYVALEHIESWTGTLLEEAQLPVRAPSRTGMASVEPGDVLFGKLRPYLAKTWVVDRPALASTELMCMRPRAGVDSRWLGYLTMATPFVEWATATSEGTKMPRTSWEKVGEYRPQVPSEPEQRAIVDHLDTETNHIDTLITKKRRMIELLTERQRLLGEEVIAYLRLSEELIPMKYLVRESDVRHGAAPEPTMLAVSIHHGVVRRDAVTDRPMRTKDVSRYKVCRPGDIVINRMRAFQGGVGVVAEDGVVSPDYTVLRVGEEVSANYLHFVMRSSWFVSEMTRRLRGIGATDQGQVRTPRINYADLGLIQIPVPAIAQQRLVSRNLAEQEALLAHLNKKLTDQVEVIAERRQALITAAVTGELLIPGVAA